MTHLHGTVLLHPSRLTGPDLQKWLKESQALDWAMKHRDHLVDLVEKADLRGMGGAGFPTHLKWRAVLAEDAPKKAVVVNGNEDEPGTFKDRLLFEWSPHQVIEGALIAALAVGASRVVLYANPHGSEVGQLLELATAQWTRHPLWTTLKRKLGSDLSLEVHLSRGLYVGGEETAAIRAINGGFPFPHRKPPYPTQQGLNGWPTLVNNVETLAQVVQVVRLGADGYRNLGLGSASGTKIYSLSGDVLKPGVFELPMGTTLRSLIFEHGGGMLGDRDFKAVFTGGPTNTLLTKCELDVPLDWDSLKAHRSRLGTGAMIVVSEGAGIVRRVAEYTEFFAEASCGQCPSCKLGTRQLSRLLRRLETGAGLPSDLDRLRHLCGLLPGSGRCGLVDAACTVVASSLEKLGEDFRRTIL